MSRLLVYISLCITLIFFFSCQQKSLETGNVGELIPYVNSKNKWGYKDGIDGRKVVKCEYDLTYPFINGIARIVNHEKGTEEKRYGLIDNVGNIITPIIYTDIAPFKMDYSIANKNGQYELIDSTGRVISKHPYEKIERAGELNFMVKHNGKFGCINFSGKEIIPCEYTLINYSEDYPELIVHNEIGRLAYFNSKGERLTPFKYTVIAPFRQEEYTTVKDTTGNFGFIDKAGNEKLFPPEYIIGTLTEGMASFMLNNKEGYIDTNGRIAFFKTYQFPLSLGYSDGLINIKESQMGKWGFYDKEGIVTIPFIYDDVKNFRGGYCVVSKNEKYGLINKKNETILNFEYDGLEYVNDSLIIAKLDGKRGIITVNGYLIVPYLYDGYTIISDSLVQFKVLASSPLYPKEYEGNNPMYGFYSPSEKEIEIKYNNVLYSDEIDIFNDDLCMVVANGKMGFINRAGNLIIPCIYDLPYSQNKENTCFRWGVLHVTKGDKKGYIDTKGREYWIKCNE